MTCVECGNDEACQGQMFCSECLELVIAAGIEDSCPVGLGYQFHRHPCSQAGLISELHVD